MMNEVLAAVYLRSIEHGHCSIEEIPPELRDCVNHLMEHHVLDMDNNGHFTLESLYKLSENELRDLAYDMKINVNCYHDRFEMARAIASIDAEKALNQ